MKLVIVACVLLGAHLVVGQRFAQQQQTADFDRDYEENENTQTRDAGVAPARQQPAQQQGGRKVAPARRQPEKGGGGSQDYEDGSADSEPPVYGGVIGAVPGVDFPDYARIPNTAFKCSDVPSDGFYADVETQCQVYHVCAENRKYDFMCPRSTVFNQAILGCDFWNSVDCSQTANFYGANAGYGVGAPEPSGDSRRQVAPPPARPQPGGGRQTAVAAPARQPGAAARIPSKTASQPTQSNFPQEEDLDELDRVAAPVRPLAPSRPAPAARPASTPRQPAPFAPAPQRTPTGKTSAGRQAARVPARGSGYPASPAKGSARLTAGPRRTGPAEQLQQAKGEFSASANTPVAAVAGISRLSSSYPRPAASRPRVSWHDFPLPVDRS